MSKILVQQEPDSLLFFNDEKSKCTYVKDIKGLAMNSK